MFCFSALDYGHPPCICVDLAVQCSVATNASNGVQSQCSLCLLPHRSAVARRHDVG